MGYERPDQRPRCSGHFLYRPLECRLVGPGRRGESTQLANELQGRIANLCFGGGRLEIEQGLDVSAHGGSNAVTPMINGKHGVQLRGLNSHDPEKVVFGILGSSTGPFMTPPCRTPANGNWKSSWKSKC